MPPLLEILYKNWQIYSEKIRDCITPLTDAQLALRPASHLRSLEEIVQHIIWARVWWFHRILQEEDAAMNAYLSWGQKGITHTHRDGTGGGAE